jgi:hypothetical protein
MDPMKTKGRILTEADSDRLAAKAEQGFDPSTWKPRRDPQDAKADNQTKAK